MRFSTRADATKWLQENQNRTLRMIDGGAIVEFRWHAENALESRFMRDEETAWSDWQGAMFEADDLPRLCMHLSRDEGTPVAHWDKWSKVVDWKHPPTHREAFLAGVKAAQK